MSSIYRKGRDGYYYYQAYVHNPVSNKKDKRIFHSLSTKDKSDAKNRQKELDLKYEGKNQKSLHLNQFIHISKLTKNFFILFLLLSSILFFFLFLNEKEKNSMFSSKQSLPGGDQNKPNKIIPKKNKIDFPEKIDIREEQTAKIDDIQIEEINKTITKYKIERVDKLYGELKLGKIYVTIDGESEGRSQLLLSREIADYYSEFLNIVICLYVNDHSGISLALGNNQNISVENKKSSWLSMYTFNEVEGEYFDDNPSGYLNSY